MTALKSKKITCDGAVHTLASALGGAFQSKFFQFLADSNNSGTVYIGGSDCDTQGFPLVGGAGQMPPVNGAEMTSFYDSSKAYYYGANGDIIYVLWGVG